MRRLGTTKSAGASSTESAPYSAPLMRFNDSVTAVWTPETGPEGVMASGAGQKCALRHPGNGMPSHDEGSAKVGVPGRRPSRTPQDALVQPKSGKLWDVAAGRVAWPSICPAQICSSAWCSSARLLPATNGRAHDDVES